MDLIADIRQIYDNFGFDTQILAASIRTVNHVTQSALIGADVITAPPNVIKSLGQSSVDRQGFGAIYVGLGKNRSENSLTYGKLVSHPCRTTIASVNGTAMTPQTAAQAEDILRDIITQNPRIVLDAPDVMRALLAIS